MTINTSTPKQQWLNTLGQERAITLKVLRAFPTQKGDFRPHPRSQSARRLMWAFVTELEVIDAAIHGTLKMPPDLPPEPATMADVISAYERRSSQVEQVVAGTPESKLHSTVPFFTGPGQIAAVPILQIMWLMLMDSVHHRGQLSVYLRIAGGKVPSIYGPSADEPWT